MVLPVHLQKTLFLILATGVLFPQVSSAVALFLGAVVALTLGNPFLSATRPWASRLLAWSVVGLGAGMDLGVVAKAGVSGVGYTVVTITTTILLGAFLGGVLGVERNTSVLVTVGTAICGGSAIAAVASAIRAKSTEVSVALGTVFILNAVALFIFPVLGRYYGMSETQFGLWSALAIHDTSSVVGATLQYGRQALEIGTTVKLARALWIIPLAFGAAMLPNLSNEKAEKPKRPWFILGFVAVAALVTWVPSLRPVGHGVEMVAKRSLVLTLFMIGSGLTRETLIGVGIRPLVQGFLLWFAMAVVSAWAISAGWIS